MISWMRISQVFFASRRPEQGLSLLHQSFFRIPFQSFVPTFLKYPTQSEHRNADKRPDLCKQVERDLQTAGLHVASKRT
jgi:hypothetical protein